MTQQNSLGTPEHARTAEYAAQLAKANATGRCVFDKENIDRNVNPVDLEVGEFWRAWKCQPSYEFHARHIVIPFIRHVENVTDLEEPEIDEAASLIEKLKNRFHMNDFAIVMRSGDPKLTGSTIRHLHWHIQEPNYMGPAFAVFAHAIGSAQIESMPEWYMDKFLMRNRQSPYCSTEPSPLQHWRAKPQQDTPFARTISFSGDTSFRNYQFIALVRYWQSQIRAQSLLGSNLFIRVFDGLPIIAKIIIPKGNGPVIEMIAPTLSEDLARWQMGSFMKMAKKFEVPKA
jgi:diadenosine tetraphosphate (Ap4A) HIT family hydrolase